MDERPFGPARRSRVRRLPKRGHYDRATVTAILDAGFIAHIGYVIDGQPYVTPTAYWREGSRLLWHGSSASRMLRGLAAGIPVCVTVTAVDGLVLARSGFHHSINYRSVMAFGTASVVADAARKRAALDAFVDRLFPGRSAEIRPVSAKELKATMVLEMPIVEASAKIRSGPPVDDEADYALPHWAEVIPLQTVIGAPEPDARLPRGTRRPAHLRPWKAGAGLDDVLTVAAQAYALRNR